jgi:hypothetical protein
MAPDPERAAAVKRAAAPAARQRTRPPKSKS